MSQEKRWVDATAIFLYDNPVMLGTRRTNIRINRLIWELACYAARYKGFSSAATYVQDAVKKRLEDDGILLKNGKIEPEHRENAQSLFHMIKREKDKDGSVQKRSRAINKNRKTSK